MKRRKLLQTALTSSVTAGATIAASTWPDGQSPAIAQERQEWRLISVWDDRSDLSDQLKTFVERVELMSAGSLILNIEKPASLDLVIQQVADGTAEMGHALPELWSAQVPATLYLMTVPFGLMPQEHYAWLTYGGGQELADRIYATLGCKYFPGGNLGMQAGGWFKAEVDPATGFNGLKIQSRGLAVEILRAVGAEVPDIPLTQARRALERGELDAVDYLGPTSDLRARFYEVAEYYYFPGWQRPATMLDFFINPIAWEALSPGLQTILSVAIEEFNHRLLIYHLNQSSVAIETLINQHNVQVRQFPEPLLLRLESLTGEILRDQATQDPLIQNLVDSLIAFRTRLTPWSRTSLSTYLNTRRWSWTLG